MSRQIRIAVWAVAIAAAIAMLYCVDPAGSQLFPPCMFHKYTGLYCPGCGSTRSLHQLAHGNLLEAIRLNPLTVAAVAAGCVGAGWRRSRSVAEKPWFAWFVVTMVVVFAIVRNIPAYPFVVLRP
jgi:hypothetical protein